MLVVAVTLIVSYVLVDGWLATYIVTDEARLGLYLLAAFGLAGWYAERQLLRWDRPTAEELYDRRSTHWHNVPRAKASAVKVAAGRSNDIEQNGKTQPWQPAVGCVSDQNDLRREMR